LDFFYQFVRFNLSAEQGWVVIPDSHAVTHSLLMKVKNLSEKEKGYPIQLEYNVSNTMISLQRVMELSYRPHLEYYLFAYQKSNSSTFKGCYRVPNEVGNVEPRSIIITKNHLILCEEDYGKWPVISIESTPSTPQFKLISKYTWADF